MNNRNNNPTGFDPATLDITDETFMEYLESAIRFSRALAEGNKSMTPGVLIFGRRWDEKTGTFGDIEALAVAVAKDFNEHDEKLSFMKQVGAKLMYDKMAPVAMFLASEAWMSHQRRESPGPFIQPRHDPERKEVIMIAGRTTQGDCKAIVIIGLHRDGEDRMRLDGKIDKMTDAKRIDTRLLDGVLHGMVDPSIKLNQSMFRELPMGKKDNHD